jgi:hypothetical protein
MCQSGLRGWQLPVEREQGLHDCCIMAGNSALGSYNSYWPAVSQHSMAGYQHVQLEHAAHVTTLTRINPTKMPGRYLTV